MGVMTDIVQNSRELEIEKKFVDIKSAAIKRMAGHLVRWLYGLEDVEQVWKPAAKMAQTGGLLFARQENIPLTNVNLKGQGYILSALLLVNSYHPPTHLPIGEIGVFDTVRYWGRI